VIEIRVTLIGKDKTEVLKKAFDFIEDGYTVKDISKNSKNDENQPYAVVELEKTGEVVKEEQDDFKEVEYDGGKYQG
jgi:hypothetical protein